MSLLRLELERAICSRAALVLVILASELSLLHVRRGRNFASYVGDFGTRDRDGVRGWTEMGGRESTSVSRISKGSWKYSSVLLAITSNCFMLCSIHRGIYFLHRS